ncbi:hypothetical protein ACN47E_003140 [Coniothyrium glycines]
MAVHTLPMREGAELVGEKGFRYLLVRPFGQPNVWLAVDAATQEKIFVVKQPGDDDLPGWPNFQHEMVMHELFKDNSTIRKHVDRILPTSPADPPRLVLEILQTTLWDARRKREFSIGEIKQIMRAALVGLQDVHAKDMVYADLKMQNILLDNFSPSLPGTTPTTTTAIPQQHNAPLNAKLGDLGIVMSPMKGLVQPIAYRAPEVYFRHEITPAIDIWAWGLIYCQLLEAQAAFHAHGMYDDILVQGPFWVKESHVQKAINNDFDLGSYNYYTGTNLPHRDAAQQEGQHWSALKAKGLPEQEIAFLKWVLDPVPTQRPTATQILESGWLDHSPSPPCASTANSTEPIFRIPSVKTDRKHSEPLLQQRRKRSQPSLFTRFYASASSTATTPPQHPHPSTTKPQHLPPTTSPTTLTAPTVRTSVNASILSGAPSLSVQDPHPHPRQTRAVSRPSTPRSRSQRPGTFLNYSGIM